MTEADYDLDNSKYTILVIDDDSSFLRFVKDSLEREKYRTILSTSAEDALKILDLSFVDIIICDYQLSTHNESETNLNGLEFMQLIKPRYREIPFLMISGHGTIEAAVDAMKSGAFDFITKPIENDQLLITVRKAIRNLELTRELNALRSEVAAKYEFKEIIGQSPKMKRMFDIMRQVIKSDTTVLIQGDSGTGKELVARALHYNSNRKNYPFIAINCSAIPETLLEAELFGYVKGAFTGAVRSKKGYFWECHGGTLFLDEIAELSMSLQAKLLRVLQEREIRPVGGDESDIHKIDVRVISATNKPLKTLNNNREFREDLYYRLAVITVEIPPLRERRSDIPLISAIFLKKYADRTKNPQKTLSPHALDALVAYNFPGNVRQLENILERAIVLGHTNTIEVEDLPEELLADYIPKSTQMGQQRFIGSLKDIVNKQTAEIERDAILHVLKETNNNKQLAATRLGISRASLYNKLKQHNITPDNPESNI